MKTSKVVFLVFLSLLSLWLINSLRVRANPEVIVVPDDYPTIQAAVDHASLGSTVFVKSGKYNETLVINKPISLNGEDSIRTILTHPNGPSGYSTNPYWITPPHVIIQINADDVKISGFTLKDCDGGISGNGNGIQINGNIIVASRESSGEGNGISIIGSHTTVFSNKVNGGDTGIMTGPGSYNNITNNECVGASVGISFLLSSFSIVSQNVVHENDAFGVGIRAGGKSNTITKNNIINGSMGMVLLSCSSSVFSDNSITEQRERAVWVDSSNHGNVIFRNYIAHNQGYAVYFTVTDFEAPTNNTFYHNTFLNNSHGVQFTRPSELNSWDNGAEGNFWSDYQERYPNAIELDGSGICSTPYVIDENNQDNYPLINQVAISGFGPTPTQEPFPTTWIAAATAIIVGVAVILGAAVYKRKRLASNKTQ